MDWARFEAWRKAQRLFVDELPLPPETDPDPFHTARKRLAGWFALEKNRERTERGDRAGIHNDIALQHFISHFEQFGRDKLARLWEYVDFLIETRQAAVMQAHGRRSVGLSIPGRPQRQSYPKARPLARRRIELNRPAVALHDAVADAQTQPGSLAQGLRREERIEDLVADGSVDAVTVIEDSDLHPRIDRPGSHRDPAARRAGVDGVGHQLKDNLVDLGHVAPDARQGDQVGFQHHRLPLRPPADDAQYGGDAGADVGLVPGALVQPGEVAQVLDQLFDPFQPVA